MSAAVMEWIELIVRWLHVMAGIAWIGSSFYFVFLDASLRRRAGQDAGVIGESWQVHGGGFYQMQKFSVAPPAMPEELHWFKWEAYMTWLSGAAMLVLVYYFGASLFLVDPAVRALDPRTAVLISMASLAAGWVVYDYLCNSQLSDSGLSSVGFVLLVAVAWGYTQVFSGRGAFIHTGALIGTIMVGNVFFVIIPNQRKTVAALIAGEPPNPEYGRQAKRRSLHNNYLTLPVVFTMISNHSPVTFDGRWNWLILTAVMVAGGAIRHFFNRKNKGEGDHWWLWMAAAGAMFVAINLSLPKRETIDLASLPEVSFTEVRVILEQRCTVCHATEPTFRGTSSPPKGVVFETADDIARSARAIHTQAVRSRAMPPGNVTEMTDEERLLLNAWFLRGASTE